MNRKRVGLVLFGVAAVLAVIIVLLVTGGDESLSGKTDPADDVATLEGPNPPADTAIADIHGASVSREGGELIFQARLSTDAPKEVPDGSLELRFEIIEGGESTWLLSATITVDVQANLLSQRTDYGSSTIDETLPGKVEISGKRVFVTVRPDELPAEWPDVFEWAVQSTLDGDLADTRSALAQDRLPDQGTVPLEQP